LAISVFLLAIMFTGIEFDDIVLGIALNLENDQDVALGGVIGTAASFRGSCSRSARSSRRPRSATMSVFKRQGRWSGWLNLGLAVVAICGIIIGAATVRTGTDQILSRHSIEGTVFGATIVTAVLSIEDLFRTARPIRRGVPEIGIGNVTGSLIFSVTGKLGIVVLAGGSVAIGSSVLHWHLTVLLPLTGSPRTSCGPGS
jgi:hypothetical protein